MLRSLFNRIFTTTWLQAETEAAGYRKSLQAERPDKKVIVICIVVCLSLIFIEYIAKYPGYRMIRDLMNWLGLPGLSHRFTTLLEHSSNSQLNNLAYWVAILAVCYLLIPMAIIKLIFREKITDYGIRKGNLLKDYKLYLGMLTVMVPIIWFFSRTNGFQSRYPFYHLSSNEPLWPNFWIWQALYLFQFFCLEFFFRGFLVHGLKKRFGYYAVFIMTIPYCMIHFSKPMPETIAAIIAGIILGTLSLKSRTIWMGVIIHYSVALAMDLSALWQKGHWH
jgi:uncharacterized protein